MASAWGAAMVAAWNGQEPCRRCGGTGWWPGVEADGVTEVAVECACRESVEAFRAEQAEFARMDEAAEQEWFASHCDDEEGDR